MSAVIDQLATYVRDCNEIPIDQVQGTSNWRVRLLHIRRAYEQFQVRVDRGIADWMEFEPYEIGDWAAIHTPIEQALWGDIRASGLPMWPQLPVGRFFVDFGNPAVRVAVECDGRAFHRDDRDAARDAELRAMGWTVYRIPGWRCNKTIAHPKDPEEMGDEDWEQYERDKDEKTSRGVLKRVAEHFPAHLARRVWRL